MIGFRPLSGHLISKSTIRTVKTLNDGDMFPSPLGASYFQIRSLFSFINDEYGFRPLSGHLISKLRFDELFDRKCEVFPSPLGASYFQISHER